MEKIITIVGPTASGKTELAIKLAQRFGGEIVSADSRQVYREMDIGTAKPTKSQLKQAKHHLINVRTPNQNYTVAEYQQDAIKAIKHIFNKGKMPFLVGGTGQYVSAVVENWKIPKVRLNQKLRAILEKLIKKRGLKFLYKKLTRLDPEATYVVDPKNSRRVIRALEVALTTEKPFTAQRQKGPKLFDELTLGLNPPKEKLKKNIAKRTNQMIKAGLISEVKKLLKANSYKLKAFNAISYREIIQYLKGQITLDQAIDLINKNTWHFARRQMTWFRRMPIVWIANQESAEKEIEKFLKN